MGHVVWLKHFVWVFAGMWTELGINRSWADDGNPNVVRPQLFGDGISQAIESPLGGGIRGPIRQRIFPRQGRDVHNMTGFGANHDWRKAANAVINPPQISIQDLFPLLWCQFM